MDHNEKGEIDACNDPIRQGEGNNSRLENERESEKE
jgi:hypothetical protein